MKYEDLAKGIDEALVKWPPDIETLVCTDPVEMLKVRALLDINVSLRAILRLLERSL